MQLVLIVRGLAKGRRQTFIDEIKEAYEVDDFVQINTPAPKDKVSKEVLKTLNIKAFDSFKENIALGKELIIVNNTNTKRYHYLQYIEYAQANNYLVAIVIIPWNDMSDSKLVIDGAGVKPAGAYKTYRREFQWEF